MQCSLKKGETSLWYTPGQRITTLHSGRQRSFRPSRSMIHARQRIRKECDMTRTMWTGGASVALAIAIGGGAALFQQSATAQSGRQPGPTFEPDPLWSQALPNKWVTGQVGGMAVDSHDNVWVFHRESTIPDGEKAASLNPPQAECCIPAPAVLEFASNGAFLQAWGGPGAGYEWFTTQ